MGLLDEAIEWKPNKLGSSDNYFVDADTLSNKDGSKRYRLSGYNAAEVEKIVDGKFKQGTAGGSRTTEIISSLANKEGFTNIKPLRNPDGSIKTDMYGRELIDLTNDNGESFNTALLGAGVFDISKYSSEGDVILRDLARAERKNRVMSGNAEASAFDQAAFDVKTAEAEAGAKSLGFKKTLETEKERADYIDYFISQGMSRKDASKELDNYFTRDVQRRKSGVTINNESEQFLRDGWIKGWTGVGENAFGVADMFGSKLGLEGLETWGELGVESQRGKLGDYGSVIQNYKDVDSVGSLFEYLGSTLAMSLPYMAVTAAGKLAAPVTFGASYSIPAMMFAGGVWNEMEGPDENKSASLAIGAGIAMTVLDTLGLKGITGSLVKTNPTKAIKDMASELAKKNKITSDAANSLVKKEVDVATAVFARDVQAMAKAQLTGAATAKRIISRVGIGGAAEGLTEVGQETIGYLAAVQGSDKLFDYDEFQERLTNAAIAGTALGGAFSIPGSAKDQLGWMDAASRYGEAASPSDTQRYAEIERKKHGTVRTIKQVLADTAAEVLNIKTKTRNANKGAEGSGLSAQAINKRNEASPADATVASRTAANSQNNNSKTFMEKASSSVMNVSNLWQASVTNAIPKSVLDRSASARALASILGGTLTPLHGGSGIEAAQHHLVTAYKNQVSDPEMFYKAMGLRSFAGVFRSSDKARISKEVYDILNNPEYQTNNMFDGSKVPINLKNREVIVNLGNQLNTLGRLLRDDQIEAGAKMGDLPNYLARYKSIDKNMVYKNQAEFKELLMTKLGSNNLSAAEAERITDEMIDNPLVNDIEDALLSNVGSLNPAAHKERTLGLSERQEFSKFFEADIFANVANAAKSAARYTTQMEYVGKDAENISHLLNKMEAEGISTDEVNRIAADVSDILEAVSGNYNRPKTKTGKKLMRFQKNVMFFMTLSALPLATFSSLPEMAMTQGALTNEQIFGKNGSIQSFTKEFVNSFVPEFLRVEQAVDDGILRKSARSVGSNIMRKLGFYSWDVGAATTTGVSEVSDSRRNVMEAFFKAIGLTQWTDYTRAIRAAMAYDFLLENSRIVYMRDSGQTPDTREAQEAEQKLRSLGVPVEQFAKFHYDLNTLPEEEVALILADPNKMKEWETTINEATYNFINQAVPLPGAANRPLIYQDPRFALFTQFQGFISTFTANQIPRMWNDYLKRGTPTMRYNTFVLLSTMIAMGFFTQAIKDQIKFDDEDDEGTLGNPYLDTPEYVRRGVMASGLLGTSERIIDMFAPIYGQRSNGIGGWAYNQATGESPTIGYVGRLADAAVNLATGDAERGIYQIAKSTPIIGPLTDTNKSLASFVTGKGWNYKDNEEN